MRKGLCVYIYPAFSFKLTVERGGCISRDSRSQSVNDHQSGKECSSVVWVEHSNKSKHENKYGADGVESKEKLPLVIVRRNAYVDESVSGWKNTQL